MFEKKGIEKATLEIKKYFGYLFEDGFQIVASKYSYKHFGNWMIVLHSPKCGIRIYQDRGQIMVMIGPPWAPANLETLNHYYDLRLIIAFFEKHENIDYHADLQHVDLQYEKVSGQFLEYYPRIIELFNRPDFADIEKELGLLQKNILTKSFPGLFEKRP